MLINASVPLTVPKERRAGPTRMAEKRKYSYARPGARHVIAFSALVLLLFSVIVVYQASRSYHTAVDTSKNDVDRLTRLLADHVELTFMAVDMNVRRVVERQYFSELFGNKLFQGHRK